MSPLFTDEQLDLQGVIQRFFTDKITSSYVRSRMEDVNSSDTALWSQFDELGIIELFRGEGSGLVELSILAMESGRALLPEYLVERILGGALLFNRYQETLTKFGLEIVGHPTICVGLLTQPKGKYKLNYNESLSIEGELSCLPSPATVLLIKIQIEEGSQNKSGWYALRLPDTYRNSARDTMLDRTLSIGEISISDTKLISLGDEISEWLEHAIYVVKACELSGLVQKVIELTGQYIKTRKQFGVPVGGFQALQHRMADMYSHSEALRSLSSFAAWAFENSITQRVLSARSAIIYGCEVASKIVESAIQLHGGIGFTWEHDLHLYLRRARSIEACYKGVITHNSLFEHEAQELKTA